MKTSKKQLNYAEKIRNKKTRKVAIIFSIFLLSIILLCIFSSCESKTKRFLEENYSAEVLMQNFEKSFSSTELNPIYPRSVFVDLSIQIESCKTDSKNVSVYELNIYKLLKSLDSGDVCYLEAYHEMLLKMHPDNKYYEFTRLIKSRIEELKLKQENL